MKKPFRKSVCLSIAAFSTVVSANAQRDSLLQTDPIIVQIQGLNFTQFVGQPVDTILAYLPSSYTSIKILPSFTSKKAQYLFVNYAPSTSVVVAVRNFSFMNPEFANSGNIDQNWDINLFKKEQVSFVVAFNGLCFNGCQNKNKIN